MSSSQVINLISSSMTIAICLFAASILLAKRTHRLDQAVFLAFFLFLYGISNFSEMMNVAGAHALAPHFLTLIFPLQFILGAVLYCYARSMASTTPHWLIKSDFLMLLWPAFALLIVARFLGLSAEEKIAFSNGGFKSAEWIDWFSRTCKMIFSLFFVCSIGYLIFAFKLLTHHVKQLRNLFSNIEEKSLHWLRHILVIVGLGWTWRTIEGLWAIYGTQAAWISPFSGFFELLWLSAIAYFGIKQEPVFARDTALQENTPEKYARSALDDERMARIARLLENAMLVDKKYKDSSLSLSNLSRHIGVADHYVSQTLNSVLGETFFDFVNRHRVSAARQLLDTKEISIVEIAHNVGYNSRSTFNSAFKKITGTTPSSYRQSLDVVSHP